MFDNNYISGFVDVGTLISAHIARCQELKKGSRDWDVKTMGTSEVAPRFLLEFGEETTRSFLIKIMTSTDRFFFVARCPVGARKGIKDCKFQTPESREYILFMKLGCQIANCPKL